MAKYTTEVRSICEHFAGLRESVGYASVDDVIANSYEQIFDEFPLFDETYRETLCCKILKHYYTREIGAESFGLWKLMLNRRMAEIMPYYNQMYESTLITIDPLKNYKGGFNRTLNKTGTSHSSDISSDNGSKTGTVDHLHTGGYTDSDGHTNTHLKTGDKETVTSGKYTDTRNGEMTAENTREGYSTDTRKVLDGNVTTNFVDLFTDTPQGNIANMGSNYGTQQNPSDVPIVGDDTSYLTTAEKTRNTVTDTTEIENKRAFSDDYKDTNKTTYDDITDAREYDNLKVKESYKDITDKDTFNGTVARTYNNDDVLDTYNLRSSASGTVEKSGTTSGSDIEALTDSGYKGISESELLEQYRKTFLNIDLDIINNLKDLFMLVW